MGLTGWVSGGWESELAPKGRDRGINVSTAHIRQRSWEQSDGLCMLSSYSVPPHGGSTCVRVNGGGRDLEEIASRV